MTTMTNLAAAETALNEARQRRSDAELASRNAAAHFEGLRARLATGDARITPDELARAKDEAEHAAILYEAAERPIPELVDAHNRALAEHEVDRVATSLRALGADLVEALERIAAAMPAFVQAARRYDAFVKEERHEPRMGASPRFEGARPGLAHGHVDGIWLSDSRAMSQLAAILYEPARAVGAGRNLLDDLKLLAAGAPQIPTA